MSSKPLFNLFGKSPIRPLQEHMRTVHECVTKLQPFFTAVMQEDWAIAENVQQQIAQLEGEADEIKRDLRLNMPKGLFMAVSRLDTLALLTRQDQLANLAKDISGLVLGRKMVFPKNIQQDYLQFLQRCIDASYQAHKAIKELDKLFEVGFSGREVKIVAEMIEVLHQIERDTDQIQVRIRRSMFAIENELPPIHAVFLYKILDWTGNLANRAQHVGDNLQILLAR
jgi:predicted phosphate transport protein (TIGR00153 family)